MKKLRKLLSIMLTMAMTLAMTVTAFATAGGDAPGDSTDETSKMHTYNVYQIFTGTYSNGTLSDIRWGKNGKDYNSEKAENGEEQDKISETDLEKLENIKDSNDNKAKYNVIKEFLPNDFPNNVTPVTTGEFASGAEKLTFSGLTPGYYLVLDATEELDNESYTFYLVDVANDTGTLEVTPKIGVPEVDKNIKVNGDDQKDSQGAIGDTVNYEFIGSMPDNIADYNTYFYKFTDTLSKGLTYNKDIKVVIRNGENDVDVTEYFYTSPDPQRDPVTGTTIIVGMEDIKALAFSDDNNEAIAAITAETKVVVTYTATINDEASIGNIGNPNKVDLEYSNNPNNSGNGATTPPPENPGEPQPTVPTGKTPESEVITYTTELEIEKEMEGSDDSNLLAGVEFTLEGTNLNQVIVETGEQFEKSADGTYYKLADGTYTEQAPIEDTDPQKDNTKYYASTTVKYAKVPTSNSVTKLAANNKVTGMVGSDGKLVFAGLSEGTYTLKETKTPNGYNTINDITIKIDYNNGKFTIEWTQKDPATNEDVTGDGKDTGKTQVVVDQDDNTFYAKIINKQGSLLPSTGGIGTTIFYIIGGILVLGAAILLITKKRMSREA